MDYEKYKAAVEAIKKKNAEHIKRYRKWLEEKKLTATTIKRHISNVEFYINEYLNYYDAQEAKAGCYCIDGYLGNFFIRKAMWSSCAQIKANGASIKKFYASMLEIGEIEEEDYRNLCDEIKEGMEEWIEKMRRHDEMLGEIDMFEDLLD